MNRDDLVDLNAFLMVADERSFTRAASRLGTSQSTLSHTIRRLEARLGVRLLVRTTRNVALTEAGDQLAQTLRPALQSIDQRLASLTALREQPAGTIRLTTSEHAASTIVWPVLETFLPRYPDIQVELSLSSALADIVTEKFDAGVRLGESLAKDMIAVRIGPPLRMAVIGAPAYFAARPPPLVPGDLAAHRCINLRFQSSGGLFAWDLCRDGREVRVRVDGQLVFNDTKMIIRAAEAGFGLGYVMEDQVQAYLADGRLVRVLEDWCPPFPGYHLYYPSRRQHTAAFALLVEALRYRGDNDRMSA